MSRFRKKLEEFKAQNRLRSLKLPQGIDFTSNDYLGMAVHRELRNAAQDALEAIDIGAAGSRLLRGHVEAHEELEVFAARYFGAEKSLFFATGFQANYALLTTLPSRQDIIIYDEFVHASMREGIQAGLAKAIKVKHNDLQAFEEALKKAQVERREGGMIWIAVESLYSMDGDFAPLADLQKFAQRYDATMIVDEAHATGVWGKDGKGFAHELPQDNLVVIHTCGKAIGVAGGLVCASADIIDYLVNAARPFIFSTAPMPLQALLVQKSLEILASKDGKTRRENLSKLIDHARSLQIFKPTSQIIPVILGDNALTLKVATELQSNGFDIRAIRPPTVPENTARLRVSLSTHIDEKTLTDLSLCLSEIMKRDKLAA